MNRFADIKTVFVDLDDTIWDFTANSKVTMAEVFAQLGLESQCDYATYIKSYVRHNKDLWEQYHHGEIEKDFLIRERFVRTFNECVITSDIEDFPMYVNEIYLARLATKDKAVEGAVELLTHLNKLGSVHILSNGFKNVQSKKLKSAHLDGLIDKIVLSDDICVTKPDRRLFDYALEVVGGKPETTVMIGDNYEADILGARNAGWKTIFFDRRNTQLEEDLSDLRVNFLKDIIPYFPL